MIKFRESPPFLVRPTLRPSLKNTQSKIHRILVYCHDTYGLGNIRRMLSICEDLVLNDSTLSVLLVSGSPLIYRFRIPPRVEHIKLPELTRTRNNGYSSKSLPVRLDRVVKLRSELIYTATKNFNPDVFLVDKKPLGVENELNLTIEYLRRQRPSTRLILLLRDILDTPRATERIWNKNNYHEVINQFFDSVLVAGVPEVFDLCREYKFPASTISKVCYCGYIKRLASARDDKKIGWQESLDHDEKRILVSVGGGQDGYRVLSHYLHGLYLFPQGHNTQSLIVTGPELPEDWKSELIEKAESFPFVKIIEFTDDILSYMATADLIISMGGYNTICEILSVKKPAIVIPRVHPVKEQWIRAERMAKMGLCRTINPDQLTPESLINAVLEEIWLDRGEQETGYPVSLGGLPQIRENIYQPYSEKNKIDRLESSPVEFMIKNAESGE